MIFVCERRIEMEQANNNLPVATVSFVNGRTGDVAQGMSTAFLSIQAFILTVNALDAFEIWPKQEYYFGCKHVQQYDLLLIISHSSQKLNLLGLSMTTIQPYPVVN